MWAIDLMNFRYIMLMMGFRVCLFVAHIAVISFVYSHNHETDIIHV